MGTQQTLDVLKSYASLLQGCNDLRAAEAVRALASALTAAGDAKLKPTMTKVLKVWKKAPEMMVSPKGLGRQLVSLQGLLAAGAAKTASAEVKLLVELLHGRREVEPNDFERLFRAAIKAPLPTATPRTASKREPLSATEVRQWADRLTAVTTDQSRFEAELSAVQAIPKLSVTELRSIAKQYLGYEPPAGKAAILKKLKTRQKQDAMEAGRQSRIQRIAV